MRKSMQKAKRNMEKRTGKNSALRKVVAQAKASAAKAKKAKAAAQQDSAKEGLQKAKKDYKKEKVKVQTAIRSAPSKT